MNGHDRPELFDSDDFNLCDDPEYVAFVERIDQRGIDMLDADPLAVITYPFAAEVTR